MAVSGENVSDYRGSVSKLSAEDFEHSCEPCLAIGQHIEAHGYCVVCQEYMCKSCFAYHQRIKATKNHQLLDKENMNKHPIHMKDSADCTKTCHLHKKEIIKFFCTNHEVLGCTDCITLNHKSCKIDYIPDKCAGIGDSVEYTETIRELDQRMKYLDTMIKEATRRDQEADSSYDHIIKEIAIFRKEINDRLDQLQKQVQTDADKKKVTDKYELNKVLETCTAITSDIKKFKSSLQDSKTSQQNRQLYIMIKQAKSKLKLDALKEARESIEQTRIQHTFERSKELENTLAKPGIFGKLSLSSTEVTAIKNKEKLCPSTPELTHIGHINIRTKSDRSECCITGCAVLTTNKLILVDRNNLKLKIVDKQSKAVTEEKELDSKPRDIVVLPQNNIAVTLPEKKDILEMTTSGKLSVIHRIPVKGECRGLTYHQGQLYVVCWKPCSVFILDSHGQVNNTISLHNKIFSSPNYILLNEAAGHIYICNFASDSIVSTALQGDVTAVYQHRDLSRPLGMMMLDDGSLLVCCYKNGTIHHISVDLKHGRTILDGLQDPYSICYNHHEKEIYICGHSDKLKITTYQENMLLPYRNKVLKDKLTIQCNK